MYWDRVLVATFPEAKEALLLYFSENLERAEELGLSHERLNECIEDFDSRLYEPEFLEKTALPYENLIKSKEGYFLILFKC